MVAFRQLRGRVLAWLHLDNCVAGHLCGCVGTLAWLGTCVAVLGHLCGCVGALV